MSEALSMYETSEAAPCVQAMTGLAKSGLDRVIDTHSASCTKKYRGIIACGPPEFLPYGVCEHASGAHHEGRDVYKRLGGGGTYDITSWQAQSWMPYLSGGAHC